MHFSRRMIHIWWLKITCGGLSDRAPHAVPQRGSVVGFTSFVDNNGGLWYRDVRNSGLWWQLTVTVLVVGFDNSKKNIGQSYPPAQVPSPVHCLWYGIPLGLLPLLSPLLSALTPQSRTPPLCLQEVTRGSTTTGHRFHKLEDRFTENTMSTCCTIFSYFRPRKDTQTSSLPFSLSLYLHRPVGVSAWYIEPTMISCWE